MYAFERPPVDLPNDGRPADDLDGLLREFFRAQLPEPWPAFRFPSKSSTLPLTAPPSRWAGLRSRFALAATVALLVLGSFFVSDLLPTTSDISKANGPRDAGRSALRGWRNLRGRDGDGAREVSEPSSRPDSLSGPERHA
jgi:hypothetical protein